MRAKDDTARVTAELNDVKRQLEACQARAGHEPAPSRMRIRIVT